MDKSEQDDISDKELRELLSEIEKWENTEMTERTTCGLAQAGV